MTCGHDDSTINIVLVIIIIITLIIINTYAYYTHFIRRTNVRLNLASSQVS